MPFRASVTPPGRIGRAIFGLLFAGVASLFVYGVAQEGLRSRSVLRTWRRTPCEIVSSAVREGPNGTWLFSARYRFSFDGRVVECADVLPGKAELSFDELPRRGELLAAYPAGGSATCLVNPVAPSEATLVPPDEVYLPTAVLVCSLFVVVGLLIAFLPSRRSRESDGFPERAGGTRRYQLGFGAVFAALGAFFASFGASAFVRISEARSWTPAEATVLRSEVVGSSGGSQTTYSPYIVYAYEFDGARREGDRFAAASVASSDPDPARRAVEEHPVGSRATVWVDPADPTRSVFSDPHGRPPVVLYVFVLFPLVFVAIGLALVVGALRSARAAGTPLPPGPPVLRDGRREQFVKGFLFTAVWNGFLALVLFLVRSSPARADSALYVFLGVFGLVGLVLVGAVVRAAAKIFAPRLELACGRGFLPRGGEALVAYRLLGGRPGDVLGARIELVAQRFELVRQGKNTYRKPVDLHRETVFETDSFRALARGDFHVALPSDAPASARGDDPIRWHFAVALDRPARKPLRDEYSVVVR